GHLHVRSKQMVAGAAELAGLVRLRAKRFHNPVAGKRFGAQMRKRFERLLTASGRPPDALAESNQRIDDEWRAGQADEREARIVIEEQRRVRHERERFAREIADGFRNRLL